MINYLFSEVLYIKKLKKKPRRRQNKIAYCEEEHKTFYEKDNKTVYDEDNKSDKE